jgi:hypothetical protein
MSYLNSSLCIFELLETKLHYELCLKNVSHTVKNQYNGNLTMKIDHFYCWSAFEIIPKSKIQNQKKKISTHFGPLFKKKKLPPYNNCINNIYVKCYCASNGKMIIFYFCKSIDFVFNKRLIFLTFRNMVITQASCN